MKAFLLKLNMFVAIGLIVAVQAFAVDSRETDSLALVDLYQATDGDNWYENDGWLKGPLENWTRVEIWDNRVSVLYLYSNNLSGTIPASLGQLSELSSLHMSGNQVRGNIPSTLGQLNNLGTLGLSDNQLTGNIPPELSSCSALRNLYVGLNNLTGSIPLSFMQLSNLSEVSIELNNVCYPNDHEFLQWIKQFDENYSKAGVCGINKTVKEDSLALVDFYNATDGDNWINNDGWLLDPVHEWKGVVASCDLIKKEYHVERIFLINNNLNGTIPEEICQIDSLQRFVLNENTGLSGTLPECLFNLSNFEGFHISGTNICFDKESMFYERYSDDNYDFEGGYVCGYNYVAPQDSLALVAFYHEMNGENWPNKKGWLTDPVKNWEHVELTIDTINDYQRVEYIYLGIVGYVTGTIPLEAKNLEYLKGWSLGPDWCMPLEEDLIAWAMDKHREVKLCGQQNNLYLDSLALVALYHSTNGDYWKNNENWMVGPLNTWHGVTVMDERINEINLPDNYMSGKLPLEIGYLSGLKSLNLSNNKLIGTANILSELHGLSYLNVGRNMLSGSISENFAGLSNISTFHFSNNYFSGAFPDILVHMYGLKTFTIHDNSFDGVLPKDISWNLEYISLSGNNFSGDIPKEWFNAYNSLRSIDLYNNKISGIPPEIVNAVNLQVLSLDNNNLSGDVPQFLADIPSLRQLNLQENNYSGELPANFKDSQISYFNMSGMDVCVPEDQEMIDWTKNISSFKGKYCIEPPVVYQRVFESDSLALLDLYNSTDGDNWAIAENWLTGPVESWHGISVNDGRVSRISLYNNSLSGDLPISVFEMDKLESLFLSRNKITGPIPENVNNATSLSSLSLSGNEMGGEFTYSIVECPNLYALYISNNEFEGPLPIEIVNSGIEIISIGNTQICIPDDQGLRNWLSNNKYWSQEYYQPCGLSQYSPADSLTLVNLYQSTNGNDWIKNKNWLTGPLGTWHGLQGDGQYIRSLDLTRNNLTGDIQSLNIEGIKEVNLFGNNLKGTLQLDFNELTEINYFGVADNDFDSLILENYSPGFSLYPLKLNGNNLTFEDLESYFAISGRIDYSLQKPLGESDTIYLSETTTYRYEIDQDKDVANNVYQWYKNGEELTGETGRAIEFEVLTRQDSGTYHCEIINYKFLDLTLTTNPFRIENDLSVELDSQTITFNALPPVSYGDAPFSLTATATSGLPVSYNSSNITVATIVGNVLTIVGVGTTTIIASQSGDVSFNPAPNVMQDLIVSNSVQSVYIPDANFKAALVANVDINSNGDSEIQLSEAEAFSGLMDVGELGISDMTGLEAFTSLTKLNCSNNQLSSLDVSANAALDELRCEDNQISSLDVTTNTMLNDLYCSSNQLSSLDVRANTALTSLSCYSNQLNTLDVSVNAALTSLQCSTNQLSSLDVSANTALTFLYCGSNQLSSLDVSANTSLTSLSCNSNQLSSLDVRNGNNGIITTFTATTNPDLSCISVSDVTFATANWTDIDAGVVYNVDCGGEIVNIPDANFKAALVANADINTNSDSEIQRSEAEAFSGLMDVRKLGIADMTGLEAFTSLTELNCASNSLGTLDVRANTALTSLICERNQLITLNVSANTTLDYLNCYSNQLTSLDVNTNTKLTLLHCGSNQLSNLDVSANTALVTLGCESNSLSSLDVSANTALTHLYCFFNQLTSLDLSANAALYDLSCSYNQLGSLDVSANTALTILHCSTNPLGSLDVSANTSLISLHCESTQLTSLDLVTNTELVSLWCFSNQLSSLDVSANTALTELWCLRNKLTSLDASSNTALESLNCSDNVLTSLPGLSGLISLIDLSIEMNNFTFEDIEPNLAIPTFTYAPQNVVPGPGPIDLNAGDELNISIPVGGSANQYQWVKDGVDIPGATSDHYVVSNVEPEDIGVYYLRITNTIVPELTLRSENIVVTDGSFGRVVAIPDANFKAALVANTDINTNGDSEIQLSEAEAFSGLIDVSELGISDMTGLEAFTSLTQLNCSNNLLSNLDVSANTALYWLTCKSNQLSGLDVSANTALTTLDCGSNKLNSLDVSLNTALRRMWCSNNQLSSLDVSANTALTQLYCSKNQLNSLDLSATTALVTLGCGSNQLGRLDVSTNMALEYLVCEDNLLSSLDVSANTALRFLACESNLLSSLDVSANTALVTLVCDSNQLSSLDLRMNTTLESLVCYSNQLISLYVGTNTELVSLWCFSNQLGSLDISATTALKDLRCNSNQLISLDVTANTALENLKCSYNSITSLPGLPGLPNLVNLSVEFNSLTFEDIEPNLAIPTFTYVPQNEIPGPGPIDLTTGDELNISIRVGGSANLYQWVKDGVDIPGATTDNLVISNVVLENAGTYYLDVTNTNVPDLSLRSEDIVVSVSGCIQKMWYADVDEDGYGDMNDTQSACIQPTGYVQDNTDCNDGDPLINPETIWYTDVDEDGFGDVSNTQTACLPPAGYILDNTDCNDGDPLINPETIWYADVDEDGFGDVNTTQTACIQPSGYVQDNTDCDDNDENVYPEAPALPDGKDNNCDGTVDKIDQTITFDVLSDVDDLTEEITLKASSNSGLLVSFEAVGPVMLKDDIVLVIEGAGKATITASQAGDANYNPAESVTQTICINPVPVISVTDTESGGLQLTSNYATGNQWMMNDEPIEGAITQNYEPAQVATFDLTVDIDGCVGQTTEKVIINALDNLRIPDANISIYPNPASDMLNLNIEGLSSTHADVSLFNLTGVEVMSKRVQIKSNTLNFALDIQQLGQGVYLLSIRAGENYIIRKIEKE